MCKAKLFILKKNNKMLDTSVCNYLHYVWMLYHVALIQKYVSLSCCSLFIYAKH